MSLGFTNHNLFLSIVQKINTTFIDDLGNMKTGSGTGFWLVTSQSHRYLFVTNKHNIVPELHNFTNFKLHSIQIKYRHYHPEMNNLPYLTTFDLDASSWEQYYDTSISSPDIAIIEMPQDIQIPNPITPHGHPFIEEKHLADQSFIQNHLFFGDSCHFTGFPSHERTAPKYDLPISRNCTISSLPFIDYYEENPKGIKTTNICLVNGLSFSGSSGSIICSYPKGVKVAPPLTGGNYIEPRIIGVMSGHWNEQESKYHSGLSYFTKSTTIIDIIKKNNI